MRSRSKNRKEDRHEFDGKSSLLDTSLGAKIPLWDTFVPSFSGTCISHYRTNRSFLKSYITCLYNVFDLSRVMSLSEKDSIACRKRNICSSCSPKLRTGGSGSPLPLLRCPYLDWSLNIISIDEIMFFTVEVHSCVPLIKLHSIVAIQLNRIQLNSIIVRDGREPISSSNPSFLNLRPSYVEQILPSLIAEPFPGIGGHS